MTNYSIRPATKDDESFLWDMLYLSIYTPEGQEPPDRDILKNPNISKYVQGWGRPNDMGFIAVNENDEPIGSITLRFFSSDNKGYGYIDDDIPELGMAVLEQYRKKGIGSKLIEQAIQEAKRRGISAISLSVDPNNPAIGLYRRFGFKEVGKEGTSVTMKLELFDNRMTNHVI